MNIFLALIFLFSSFGVIAADLKSCEALALNMSSGRVPASDPNCRTAGQLMSSNLNQRQFQQICRRIVEQDEGCQRLQPAKRMSCNAKRENEIFSSANLGSKFLQCAKGFLWDSMVELGKFVIDLIQLYVRFQVNNVTAMARFLTDSSYRERVFTNASNAPSQSFRLAKAFLNSSSLYFAREFPRNLARHPFNPMLALGKTLLNPILRFVSDAVQNIIAYYVPQYQCMNGVSKLHTWCKLAGDIVMPPTIMFTWLKFGVRGLQNLRRGREAARISRFETRFATENGVRAVRRNPPPRTTRREPAPRTPARPRDRVTVRRDRPRPPAEVHPARPQPPRPLERPIDQHTDDELIEIARSEREATAALNRAEAERIAALNAQNAPAASVADEAATVVDEVPAPVTEVAEYRTAIQNLSDAEKVEATRVFEQLSGTGASPSIIVGIYQKYAPYIRPEMARAPAGSEDLWLKLGRFYKRERQAGKTDEAIQRQLDEALNCN